jgi:energy-coupling factor transport system ATP-binding protein
MYPEADRPALSGVNLSVKEGEFAVLSGPSGSGKSTLLRLLKREVSPGGRLNGTILLDDRPIEAWPAREAAARVGLVMQHPDQQLVVDTVEHELAFGMENLGFSRDAMRRRMAEMAGFFGLEPLLSRRTDELSGGQKQTVNLAAVLMLQPRLLLLDEPLAQLDPLSARELLGMIRRLNDEWGITVLMSEHRVDDLLPAADRVVRLEEGAVAFDGSPREFAREAWERRESAWLRALPAVTRWALERGLDDSALEPAAGFPVPLSVKEGRQWVRRIAEMKGVSAAPNGGDCSVVPTTDRRAENADPLTPAADMRAADSRKPLLEAEELFFAYDARSPAVLRGLDWTVRSGDRIALFGGNGSGKSTLLRLLAGLHRPQRGRIRLNGEPFSRIASRSLHARIGYLAQNPQLHFAFDTLREDLTHAAARIGALDPVGEALRMASRFGLTHALDRHPHDLSGGERQLGALAVVLLGKPELLLLDEPTKGIDAERKMRLAVHLEDIHREGATIVMATHDVEFAAAFANRCSLLFQGEIVADDMPGSFFRGNLFYATPLHRLLGGDCSRSADRAERGEALR